MNLRCRLQRLERTLPKPVPLADEERLRRLHQILAYQGANAAAQSIRTQMIQLLQSVRVRLAAQGIEWPLPPK